MIKTSRFNNKDVIGAVLLILLGALVTYSGFSYRIGTLYQMGAGFVPAVLGIAFILVGVALALTSAVPRGPAQGGLHVPLKTGTPQWRGWICIVGGVIAFAVLGSYGGFVVASFASVFIAAMGDRTNTAKSAGLLAFVMTAFGVAVFHYGLHLQIPLFTWG